MSGCACSSGGRRRRWRWPWPRLQPATWRAGRGRPLTGDTSPLPGLGSMARHVLLDHRCRPSFGSRITS
ncbi:hypothetical protein BHE74_00026119 [Ensete ventricosum]|nr:hypothetical protein GW17_00022584 [Ensete ventricosum]RWW66501.1 hypothetical protein BHE74_00026119 [Ensete ventricosum]